MRPKVIVREATAKDNDALVALAAACPMKGEIGLCVDRAPDFFALNRLQGRTWRLFVAEVDGEVAGCMGAAARDAYLHGAPSRVAYPMDLKVFPHFRGPEHALADRLVSAVYEACCQLAEDTGLIQFTILAGNRPPESRSSGPRGQPEFSRFASLNAYSVPLLTPVLPPRGNLRVDPAEPEDTPEMLALWRRHAPNTQFAPVFDEDTFAHWTVSTPGLALDDYILVRDDRTRDLLGFAGLWNQKSFKQLRVTAYSTRLQWLRKAFNLLGAVTGGPRLPQPGGELSCLTLVHLCTPSDRPRVLRALLVHAINDRRGEGFAVLNLGLDARDPQRTALRGLFAQPTRIHVYFATPSPDPYDGPPLADRLLHHEIAMV